jgi:glycosyltransferase involved in cell wall biosynthesis
MSRSSHSGQSQAMHVLDIVPGLQPGGMELTLARLIQATEGHGIRHTVVCLKGDAVIADRLPASVPIHCLHSRPNDPLLPWRLWRLIRQIRPTVIHARNWGAWPDVALARLLVRPRVPLVFGFHGLAGVGPMPLRRRLAFRILSRITTYPLTVCEATKEMLIRELGWPAKNVRLIPNGIDAARFVPRSSTTPASQRLVIGCVGSLTPVKNHAMLLRAFSTLLKTGIDAELRIAGEGPERSALERLAAELGVASRLSLCGQVGDIPEFLHGLDVFALPSSSEAHPNALLEAMACGLPCVATDVGGVPEVLDGGRCGRLSPRGDPEQFAENLRDLCTNDEARQSLAAAARERVLERYSMQKMVAAYTRLYREASGLAQGNPTTDSGKRADRDKPRILQLGPLPPLTGGMATVTCNLRDSDLRDLCDMETINNGKTTPEGRPLFSGVWAQVRLLHHVLRNVRRRRVSLVHIHTCALFSFWRDIVHMMAIRASGCRVVWHLHDGTFPRFISQGNPLKRALIRWALRRAAATIVLSDATLDALRPYAPGVRWRVVPNGVPLNAWRPSDADSHDAAATGLKLIFLGNLTRRKGAYDLIAAVEAAARQGVRVSLALAGGEVEPGQRLEIERRIADSPCASQICLLGLVHGDEKHAALSEADCVALPSYAEGLPMALLEGMAAGLPAIATRVGSIPALVDDGVEGFLVPAGDVDALAERMCCLAQDPGLRRRMAQNARNRVERDFSQRAMAERVFRIYQAAINGEMSRADEDGLQTEAIRA